MEHIWAGRAATSAAVVRESLGSHLASEYDQLVGVLREVVADGSVGRLELLPLGRHVLRHIEESMLAATEHLSHLRGTGRGGG